MQGEYCKQNICTKYFKELYKMDKVYKSLEISVNISGSV